MTITKWVPISDPVHLAIIGKAGEELNELAGRLCRTIIQGIDATDPASKNSNAEEITREISDVLACLIVLQEETGIGADQSRVQVKASGYRTWLKMLIGPY